MQFIEVYTSEHSSNQRVRNVGQLGGRTLCSLLEGQCFAHHWQLLSSNGTVLLALQLLHGTVAMAAWYLHNMVQLSFQAKSRPWIP